jgi:hypothetical protein
MACRLLVVMALLCAVYGSVLPSISLPKRDICDMDDPNFEPVLYKSYTASSCPPKYTLDAQENCPFVDYNIFDYYCQIRMHNKNWTSSATTILTKRNRDGIQTCSGAAHRRHVLPRPLYMHGYGLENHDVELQPGWKF